MRLVAVDRLKPGMVVGKTIFGSSGQILLRQGVELTDRYIAHLRNHFIEVIYVSTGSDVPPQDVISDQTRVRALAETKRLLGQVKRGTSLEVEQVHQALIGIIDELLLQEEVMINLVDIRSFDEELFHHSVNVAILAVIVGIELDYSKRRLQNLAVGALLHDIGKLFSDDDVEHVTIGCNILRNNGNIDSKIITAIYQHHEHWDGKGYPDRLSGSEICRDARILQVTNVFDHMSANSRYPMEEVIEFLMALSGTRFEPATVRAFLNCVSFYPVGTRVTLNTGEYGVVVKANRGFPTRPVVQILGNQYGLVNPPYELDLTMHPTYFVVNCLDNRVEE